MLQPQKDSDEEGQVGSSDNDAATDLSSRPGRHDKDGNPIITIVDRSGVHEIGVCWCCCSGAPERDAQLMMAGLFPATFHNPKTAFTFRVLEEYHLDNLECKTTPSQFFSRLRRLTNDEFPNTVPVGGFSIAADGRLTGRCRTDIGSC
jgi:CxC2 like cysteine cluster associated with KDZ transposases